MHDEDLTSVAEEASARLLLKTFQHAKYKAATRPDFSHIDCFGGHERVNLREFLSPSSQATAQ
ncbi:hypothetical protein [Methylobacterium brachythecii]|uniref:Uncharacterized protein n=1 Tax=Methylobacterium brachythecii TaxID=1176177 RepID=A0A7W6AQC0_9HYPH|nr:hypothetical protein [Methylobacterium brachythecii]MBB3903902.1 hypothetical protein [Methylobacterium brachythecii]